MPAATLEFAALCLTNALQLLDNAESLATQKLKEELGENANSNISEKILVPAPPSLPMKAYEVSQLRLAFFTTFYIIIGSWLTIFTLNFGYAVDFFTVKIAYLSHMYKNASLFGKAG